MTAHIHKTLCIRFSCLTWQILTVFVGIGFIFWFSDVTIQAATEFTEKPILRLETGQHTAMVRRISVDAQQRFLVSGSEDKTARVYDIKTGRLLQILRIPIEGTYVGRINAVAISPDGSTVAIGGWTGKKAGEMSIYLLERNTGKMIRRMGDLPGSINHLTYSPDGHYLAAILYGGAGLRIYDTKNYRQITGDADYGDFSWWCSFDSSNRLATTSFDGYIRLYNADFKLIQKKRAPGGTQPLSAAFSPGSHKIAVGYADSTRVDVLSADDLGLLFSANTEGVDNNSLGIVTWSSDGRYLYAGGRYNVSGYNPILRWDKGGRGKVKEFRIATNTVMGLAPLDGGRLAVGAGVPLVGVLGDNGKIIWQYQSGIADFRGQRGTRSIRLSQKGDRVVFGFEQWGKSPACFSLTDRQLTLDPPEDKHLLGPITEAKGLNITDWENSYTPKLDDTRLELEKYEYSRSLAISPDGSHFFLGTEWYLRCFDRKGKEVWQVDAPGAAWTVTISSDGRLAVAGLGDGTLRWYRMEDGKELLALFAHPDGKRWVVWTPEGYYHASTGGEDLIGWHLNHGVDTTPEFFGVSRFRQQFYRPDVIAQVLQTLDTDKALQLADNARGQKTVTRDVRDILPPTVSILAPEAGAKHNDKKLVLMYKADSENGEIISIEAQIDGRPAKTLNHVPMYDKNRQSVVGQMTLEIPTQNCQVTIIAKNQNGSSEPARYYVNWEGTPDWYKPELYVLAVGVNDYRDSSYDGLNYCAKDAEDFVNAVKKQEGGLYQKVSCRLLDNDKAKRDAILDGLDWLEHETTSRDVAMVFLSGHGMRNPRDGKYQFLPHDADPAHLNRTTVDDSQLKKFLGTIAGKTVLFLDTCHSGKLMSGQKGDTQPDTDRLANELAEADTGVIVFASSTGKQISKEDEKWGNGAFTRALIEGIEGQADYTKDWYVSIAELEVWIPAQVKKLTEGSQTPVTAKPKAVEDLTVFHVIQEKKGEGKK